MQAAIVGLGGLDLTEAERRLFTELPPSGVILFARNIETPAQVADLMRALDAVLPPGAARLVDQEGGRVARLRPPAWPAHPSAATLGALHGHSPAAARRATFLTGALLGMDCAETGFTVTTAPVLDVVAADAHDVIGDRAFGSNARVVAELGAAMAAGLAAGGIQPMAKHMPGHGRARADSHYELPRLDDVTQADLMPFRVNSLLPWGMTAHIVYTAQDPALPATLSASLIRDVIRGEIGFDGVLVSDDLGMKALSGPLAERASLAVAAGCDLALHCSGIVAESEVVLRAAGPLSAVASARLARAGQYLRGRRQALGRSTLTEERDALLRQGGAGYG